MAAKKPWHNPAWQLSFPFVVFWQLGWSTTANLVLDVLLLGAVAVFDHHELHVHLASDCSGHVRDVSLMQTSNWRKEGKAAERRERD